MKSSRRYEFDVASGTASFRYHGRGKPSAAFCAAMQTIAGASMSHFATEDRACDPRLGDRFTKDDGTVILEVVGRDEYVRYTVPHYSSEVQNVFLWFYQKIVQSNLKHGFTFHAVEDDEE